MGLISTEVSIKVCSNNYKHLQEKGVQIPLTKNGTIDRYTPITIPVEFLMTGSGVKVEVVCDYCGKHKMVNYADYFRCNHNGKYYCHPCVFKALYSGENSVHYDHTKSDEERNDDRSQPEYNEFVKKVFSRDNYTCQCCGKKSQNDIEAHHLDGYNWCKEKRTDDTNGITLCKNCHQNFHNIYGRGNNTKEQFEEWIGYTLIEFETFNGKIPMSRAIYDYEENKIYRSANEYANTHNCTTTQVYDVCGKRNNHRTTISQKDGTKTTYCSRVTSVRGHHLFWYDEYIKLSQQEVNSLLENFKNRTWKTVLCITTGIKFDNCRDASNYYNIHKNGIKNCCQGRSKSAGKLPDGIKLRWMYLSDFEKLSKEEQEKLLNIKDGEQQWQNT